MRAYLREDGRYDLYDVEPQIISAEEFEAMKRRQELEARKQALLEELSAVDNEIANMASAPEVKAEPATASATTEAAPAPVAMTPIKKRW